MAKDIRQIKRIVEEVLRTDKKARSDDDHLYVEVLRKTNPELLYQPFYITMTDKRRPNTETVRRSRQWCQEHFKELAADVDVEAMRDLQEEMYREVFCNG